MQHRIDNPGHIDADAIIRQHGGGDQVIVQFSHPCYSEAILRDLNDLCERLTSRFQVRFYSHYGTVFDCRTLRSLPSVRSLRVDCEAAENHLALTELDNLDELSLGIFLLDDPQLLGAKNLRNLSSLTIAPTKKSNFDLSCLAGYGRLRSLFIGGHAKGIDTVAELSSLADLGLSGVGNAVPLGFVNSLEGLKSLRIMLGGRASIDEIEHEGLRALSVIRVRGFEMINPSAFPGLSELHIEDQTRLRKVSFSETSKSLSRILVFNCKGLVSLTGLQLLHRLNELRISRTGLDIEEILASPPPRQLRSFAFYSGKTGLDKQVRKRLDDLGYAECAT